MKRDFHYNSPKMKSRRKELRNKLTPQEKKLWAMIKNSRIGYKFIRQYSVDNYVLDFFCPEKRIGIEIDGSSHLNKVDYDLFRIRYISACVMKHPPLTAKPRPKGENKRGNEGVIFSLA